MRRELNDETLEEGVRRYELQLIRFAVADVIDNMMRVRGPNHLDSSTAALFIHTLDAVLDRVLDDDIRASFLKQHSANAPLTEVKIQEYVTWVRNKLVKHRAVLREIELAERETIQAQTGFKAK